MTRLSDNHIAAIQAWVKSGAPEGDPKDLPRAPVFQAGWHIKPDVVLTIPRPRWRPATRMTTSRETPLHPLNSWIVGKPEVGLVKTAISERRAVSDELSRECDVRQIKFKLLHVSFPQPRRVSTAPPVSTPRP
jgi:hypothetical protein